MLVCLQSSPCCPITILSTFLTSGPNIYSILFLLFGICSKILFRSYFWHSLQALAHSKPEFSNVSNVLVGEGRGMVLLERPANMHVRAAPFVLAVCTYTCRSCKWRRSYLSAARTSEDACVCACALAGCFCCPVVTPSWPLLRP